MASLGTWSNGTNAIGDPMLLTQSKMDSPRLRSKTLISMLNMAIGLFNKSTHDMVSPVSQAAPSSSDRDLLNKSSTGGPESKIDNLPISIGLEEHQAQYSFIIALSAIVFALGMFANLAVIGRVLRQGVLRARIRMLLLSLSCADVLLMVLEFPLNQFAWMSMRVWKAGDLMCRASAFSRAFAAYLISFILVVISLDRCLNIVKPAALKAASKRMKKLLWCALLFAFICASPQWAIFHTSKIPNHPQDQYQCVSRGLVDDDDMVKVVYPLFCMMCQYIIPVVLISLDYTIILYAMSKPLGQLDYQQLIVFRPTPALGQNGNNMTMTNNSTRPQSSSHDSYIRKAQMKTLHILLLTVAIFAMCWLPYYIILLFYLSKPHLANEILPYWVFKLTELLAVSNACVNPFVYGNYLLKVKERCKSCWP